MHFYVRVCVHTLVCFAVVGADSLHFHELMSRYCTQQEGFPHHQQEVVDNHRNYQIHGVRSDWSNCEDCDWLVLCESVVTVVVSPVNNSKFSNTYYK